MSRIKKVVCKVNENNYDDFKNKLGLTGEKLYVLISQYLSDPDPKKIEDVVNNFEKHLIYDVLHGRVAEQDLYEFTIVDLNAPRTKDVEIVDRPGFDSLDLHVMKLLEESNPEVMDLLNNPNAVPMFRLLQDMTTSTTDLEERIVDVPKTHQLKSIKDILDVVNTENVDYFLHDFSVFLKYILTLKESIKITSDYLPNEIREDLGTEDIRLGDIMTEPDLFTWIDDGQLNHELAIQCFDPDTNENYMDITFKKENGQLILDVDDKKETQQKLIDILNMLKSNDLDEDSDDKKDED